MQQHFEVNEVEENDFLGMQIHQDRANRRLYLSQRPALVKAIATAMGPDTATEPTPVVVNTKFTKEDTPDAKRPDNWVTKEEAAWYLRSVATMIYFYNHSRPDFGFGISKLCKFMQNPGKCLPEVPQEIVPIREGYHRPMHRLRLLLPRIGEGSQRVPRRLPWRRHRYPQIHHGVHLFPRPQPTQLECEIAFLGHSAHQSLRICV